MVGGLISIFILNDDDLGKQIFELEARIQENPPLIQNLNHAASPEGDAALRINPGQSVAYAKRLHRLLFDETLSTETKNKLAREVAGVLFSAEANSILSNRARILFLNLRTHAHLIASGGAHRHHNETTLSSAYDELELLVRE